MDGDISFIKLYLLSSFAISDCYIDYQYILFSKVFSSLHGFGLPLLVASFLLSTVFSSFSLVLIFY